MSVDNTPEGVQALLDRPQWVVVKLARGADGRLDKIPVSYVSPKEACNAHDTQHWTTYAAARVVAAMCGSGFTVGFVLTAADPFFVLDIDGARQADGTWSALAQQFVAALPGCMVEVSLSGTGLHIWGRYPNPPPHRKRRTDLGIELYTEARFIVLGTNQTGDIAPRCEALPAFLAEWFPPNEAATVAPLQDRPRSDWRGPADDDELIRRALQSRSTASVFGSRASFADLWAGDVDALARAYPTKSGDAYDRSSADAALAQHLAFWTGADRGRIERLMRRSALVRDKWDAHAGYLAGLTIANACARQRDVLQDKPPEPNTAPPVADDTRHQHPLLPDDPMRSARGLLEREFAHPEGDRLKAWQGSFYRWDSSHWRGLTAEDTRATLYRFLEAQRISFYVPNQANVNKLHDALAAAAHVDSRLTPPCWLDGRSGPDPRDIVPCANGLLHLPSRELRPATPAFFSTNAAPFAYQPDAPPPLAWGKFLCDVWPGDSEAIATLQEVFGYLLTPDTSQQKLFLIVGPKRSGKGTIGRVLHALIGRDNVASPTLSSLAGEFGLQPLVGKLMALVSDARIGTRADPKVIVENLLRISGEDSLSVNRKYLESAEMRLGARFVLLTNELPRIADASGAMASRFVILKMGQSFYGREDPGLTSRLLQELPGILNWSIEGWQRLRARGHFVQPRSSLAEAEELADLGSPVAAFVRDACEVRPGLEVECSAIYQAWRQWCAEQGIERPSARPQFGTDLAHAVEGITVAQPRRGAERVRVYCGLTLKPDALRRLASALPR